MQEVKQLREDYDEAGVYDFQFTRASKTVQGQLEAADALAEDYERLIAFADEVEAHHGIEEVAEPTQPPTDWDHVQKDLAREVREARENLAAYRRSREKGDAGG